MFEQKQRAHLFVTARSRPVVACFGGDGPAKCDGKRGADRGSCGSMAGDWRASQCPPITGPPLPLARPCIQTDPSNQWTRRPLDSRPSHPRTGTGCCRHRPQVTQRGRYFRPNPVEPCPSCEWQMCLERAPSKSEAISHPRSQWTSPRTQWLHCQCRPGRPLDTRAGARLRWFCVSSAAIYPSRAR